VLQIYLTVDVILPWFPAIAEPEVDHLDGSRKSFYACITHLSPLRRLIMRHSEIITFNSNIRLF
jgi:hypothetical protein